MVKVNIKKYLQFREIKEKIKQQDSLDYKEKMKRFNEENEEEQNKLKRWFNKNRVK